MSEERLKYNARYKKREFMSIFILENQVCGRRNITSAESDEKVKGCQFFLYQRIKSMSEERLNYRARYKKKRESVSIFVLEIQVCVRRGIKVESRI